MTSTEARTVAVPAAAFKAALRFASKDETRRHLMSVLIDRVSDDDPRISDHGPRPCLVATDGHRLVRISWDAEDVPSSPLLLPREDVQRIVKASAKDATVSVSERQALVGTTIVTLGSDEPDGRIPDASSYPTYRRVLGSIPGESERAGWAAFNPAYVADMCGAVSDLFGKAAASGGWLRIYTGHHDGRGRKTDRSTGPVRFTATGTTKAGLRIDLLGIIMPVND